MHPLKDKTLWFILEGDDALATQNIRTLALNQIVEPGHEALRIDIAVVSN